MSIILLGLDFSRGCYVNTSLTNELRLEEAYRWARVLRIPDGTAEIQRRTIARRLLSGDTEI